MEDRAACWGWGAWGMNTGEMGLVQSRSRDTALSATCQAHFANYLRLRLIVAGTGLVQLTMQLQ
jgi:hypothetical protein